MLSSIIAFIFFSVGLKIGSWIYTPSSYIHLPGGSPIDIVWVQRREKSLVCRQVVRCREVEMELHPVPPGYKLTDEQGEPLKIYPGSSFRLRHGQVVLSKTKRRALGFVREEVGRSNRWPFQD